MNTPLPDKPVVLKFTGGPRDGDVERSDGPRTIHGGFNDATAKWVATEGCPIGCKLTERCEAWLQKASKIGQERIGELGPMPMHAYEVISHEDGPNELLICLEYDGMYIAGKKVE